MGSRRIFVTLAATVLLLGIADSMPASFIVLFAANAAKLSPLQVGLLASASGIGGIAVSFVLGRRFDRHPTKAYAVGVTSAGAVGFVLLSQARSFPLLLLLELTLVGGVAAAFPQLFALARVVLGDGTAGQRSAPLLRSAWSLAWALGPLAGAALLGSAGFTGIFLVTAGVLVLTALAALALPSPDRPPAPNPSAGTTDGSGASAAGTRPVSPFIAAALALSVLLFFLAMFAGSIALPLYVTRGLHRPGAAVGLLYSACAAVEIVAALALAAVPERVSQRLLILGAMVLFVGYFAITVLAQGLGLLVAGQVARGIAIAVVGAAGIRYFQDAMAPATGRATTLFANASTAGLLVAGVLAGAAVQTLGYRPTLFLCGVVALLGATVFALATRPRWQPVKLAADSVTDSARCELLSGSG
jgi:SET family sugar efflux transporter-like MFS transporter